MTAPARSERVASACSKRSGAAKARGANAAKERAWRRCSARRPCWPARPAAAWPPTRIARRRRACRCRAMSSLKFDEVNARSGPSDDHRLLWVYHVRGPAGAGGGRDGRVATDLRSGRRAFLGARAHHRRPPHGDAHPGRARAHPRAAAHERAASSPILRPRALAAVDRCQKDWCQVHVGAASGWVAGRPASGARPTRRNAVEAPSGAC